MAGPGHGYFFRHAAELIAGDCAPGLPAAGVADSFVRNLADALCRETRGLELARQPGPGREILQFTAAGSVKAIIICRPAGAFGTPAGRAAAGRELAAALDATGAAFGLHTDGYLCREGELRDGSMLEGDLTLLSGRHLSALSATLLLPGALRRLGAQGRPRRRHRRRIWLALAVIMFAVIATAWWLAGEGPATPAGGTIPPGLVNLWLQAVRDRLLPASDDAPAAAKPATVQHVANAPPGPVTIYSADSGPLTLMIGPAQLTLDSGTRMTADQSGGGVFLIEGVLTAVVRALGPGEKFSVVTGNATVGVRGTTFRVAYRRGPDGRGYTSLEVIDGVVEMTATGPGSTPGVRGTSVSAGQSFVVAGGMAPQRAAGNATGLTQAQLAYLYNPDELARLAREARQAARARAVGEPYRAPAAPPGMQPDAVPGTLHGIDLPTFSGNGTWSSAFGFRGPVSITIDVRQQKFRGEFTGQGERAGVLCDLAGTFSGDYHGDARSGDMAGTTIFSISNAKYRQEVQNLRGQVSGSLRNRLIAGKFRGEQVDGEFSVIVRVE